MPEDFSLEQLQLFTQLTTFVHISPKLDNDEEVFLLSGQIKKLRANYEQTVPLWFALVLKKQQKCQILPPYWMNQTQLQTLYNNQCASSQLINLQNTQFFQISYIILNNAADDLKNPTKLRNLVDSLKSVREMIIIKKFRNNSGFTINSVTTYQLNKFRKAKNIIMQQLNSLQWQKQKNKQ